MIYVSVHSIKHYDNHPERADNNDYFKHYFSQVDLDNLFDSNFFDMMYSADIQRQKSKLEKVIVDSWLEKYLDNSGISNKKERVSIKANYCKGKFESDIVTIYRKK